jgi:AcrR family transcriptional regulator
MRKTQHDWLQAGMEILASSGAPALTIDSLSSALGVTKGSFYHHFKGFADFKTALLEFYAAASTLHVIALTEQQTSPAAKIHFLFDLVLQGTPEPEIALRAWAQHDPEARAVQSRIDAQRIEYVRSLCLDLAASPEQALLMARMVYAILVGSAQIQPPFAQATLRQLFDEFLTIYAIKA